MERRDFRRVIRHFKLLHFEPNSRFLLRFVIYREGAKEGYENAQTKGQNHNCHSTFNGKRTLGIRRLQKAKNLQKHAAV
jgi:hypothetical protein